MVCSRLQLGHGAADGRGVPGVASCGHLPSASRPAGTVLRPDEVAAAAVRQVPSSQPGATVQISLLSAFFFGDHTGKRERWSVFKVVLRT